MIHAKKLSKMIQQWHKFAATAARGKRVGGGEGCCVALPVDRGHFAIYTADERRFVVPLAYLNDPVFRQLLEMSEEEYGLPCNGPIVLPCDSVFMDYAICLIRKGRAGDLHRALLESLARSRCSSSSCLHQAQINHHLLIH
ncbi:auxin-responsive protein SAUR66-like [Salvia miltiorrhiza]|uniref:auxin-responsive protein SAUR66-like n=1 Tax=Salvia miltiorrhiza TaxID=226208 RepID=UPI0025AB9E8F|nr:auxin-responsive protein SAUR66-like [Salvia miltiorrhiza]